MISKINIKNIGDLLSDVDISNDTREKINCIAINRDIINSQLSQPAYLNAFVAILVLSGSGEIHINYKSYQIEKEMIILLTVSHLFRFISCTSDFQSLCLLVSKDFMEEMDATDMIYKRIKYGAILYRTPIVKLNKVNTLLLKNRILSVDKAIDKRDHFYYKDMILNSLFAFYLDLSNIIEKDTGLQDNSNLTRHENIIGLFIELLVANYRTEHKVDFYASRLNITSHYLTLIVKRLTGQTVNEFIFEMLYSESRNLLTHSRLSIQEIAALLNFSDQASFGKFFKRKSGVSPIEFRKGILWTNNNVSS